MKRFLRDIQNKHERDDREAQKAKLEVERLNNTVKASHVGPAPVLAGSLRPSSNPKTQPSPADRQRQLAQLAEMGIQVPEHARGDLALAGQWQTLSRQVVEEPAIENSLSVGIRKRKVDEDEDGDLPMADHLTKRKNWGSSTKQYPNQQTSDLDALLSFKPTLKSEVSTGETKTKQRESPVSDKGARSPPKVEAPGPDTTVVETDPPSTKTEDGEVPHIKTIPEAIPEVLFKKRKLKHKTA